MLFAKQLG